MPSTPLISQTAVDEALKSPAFRARLAEADRLSSAYRDLLSAEDIGDIKEFYWATRIAWVTLTEGPQIAKRFAARRSNFRESPAWTAYSNLLSEGIISEEQNGIYYTAAEPWESRVFFWVFGLILAAKGTILEGFPRQEPAAREPGLRLVHAAG